MRYTPGLGRQCGEERGEVEGGSHWQGTRGQRDRGQCKRCSLSPQGCGAAQDPTPPPFLRSVPYPLSCPSQAPSPSHDRPEHFRGQPPRCWCCSGCSGTNRTRGADHPATTCSAPWAKRNAASLLPCARSTAACAIAPSASTTAPAAGRPARTGRKSLQLAISAGVGLLAGGTHFTAFVMRAPCSTRPSCRDADTGALPSRTGARSRTAAPRRSRR